MKATAFIPLAVIALNVMITGCSKDNYVVEPIGESNELIEQDSPESISEIEVDEIKFDNEAAPASSSAEEAKFESSSEPDMSCALEDKFQPSLDPNMYDVEEEREREKLEDDTGVPIDNERQNDEITEND
jgi:hypothetical protein